MSCRRGTSRRSHTQTRTPTHSARIRGENHLKAYAKTSYSHNVILFTSILPNITHPSVHLKRSQTKTHNTHRYTARIQLLRAIKCYKKKEKRFRKYIRVGGRSQNKSMSVRVLHIFLEDNSPYQCIIDVDRFFLPAMVSNQAHNVVE